MSAPPVAILEQPLVRRTVWRAAAYEALALAFSYPDEEAVADLVVALEALRDHGVTHESGAGHAVETVLAALGATDAGRLAAVYTTLFAGDVPRAPCETDYEHDGFAKARQLADIAGFYRAFGLKVAVDRPGPADFIATELEFMSIVAQRQAYAAANGWHEQRQVCEEAQRAFLEDHLGRWLPAFCRALVALDDPSGPVAFYPAVAALCDEVVQADLLAFGARPLPAAAGRLRSEPSAFTCIYAETCAADAEGQP
jgi:TorA maturation chaperone TorD